MAEPAVCHIRSTLDDRGRAACLMQWGPIQALLKPDTVLETARDLIAAAIRAETDVALVDALRQELKLPDHGVGAVLKAVRSRRPLPPAPAALRIEAVAGAKTSKPYVHIARGSMTGQLSPDEARDMALAWIQTATAAHIDVRLRYALGEWDRLNVVEIEELFALIQKAAPQ